MEMLRACEAGCVAVFQNETVFDSSIDEVKRLLINYHIAKFNAMGKEGSTINTHSVSPIPLLAPRSQRETPTPLTHTHTPYVFSKHRATSRPAPLVFPS